MKVLNKFILILLLFLITIRPSYGEGVNIRYRLPENKVMEGFPLAIEMVYENNSDHTIEYDNAFSIRGPKDLSIRSGDKEVYCNQQQKLIYSHDYINTYTRINPHDQITLTYFISLEYKNIPPGTYEIIVNGYSTQENPKKSSFFTELPVSTKQSLWFEVIPKNKASLSSELKSLSMEVSKSTSDDQKKKACLKIAAFTDPEAIQYLCDIVQCNHNEVLISLYSFNILEADLCLITHMESLSPNQLAYLISKRDEKRISEILKRTTDTTDQRVKDFRNALIKRKNL